MLQKRSFKVLSPIPKLNGGGVWWMRVGSAHTNKDDSINVYLDAVPKDHKFTLRELDAEDLRKREMYRANSPAGTSGAGSDLGIGIDSSVGASSAPGGDIPF